MCSSDLVVPRESPASWADLGNGAGINALKAQAVAARSYSIAAPSYSYATTCDTTACQVYGGMSSETARGNTAVRATARQVLTSGGSAAFTQFSSSSGGWTTAGSRPYLVAEADPYDDHSANPLHDWSVRLTAARIEGAYPGIGRLRRLHVVRRDGHGQWGGRVQSIVLDGGRKDVTLSGDTFRSRFGLRSTWFAG